MRDRSALNEWFCAEVLPLEPALVRLIRRYWRSAEDVADIRQDIYERTLIGAARGLPAHTRGYVFTIARNVMINRARQAQVVSIELVAELDDMSEADLLTPERHLEGREALRQVDEGLNRLPRRCREVIRLRKVEGLTTRETAEKMGIGIDAVEQQMTYGMRALADFLLGGSGAIRRYGAKRLLRRKAGS